MDSALDVGATRECGRKLIFLLGLSALPVGVRFVTEAEERIVGDSPEKLRHHRYCQALMKARRGLNVTLDGEELSCPAAAATFGFRPLPEGLQSGRALVGAGIVSDEKVGQKMLQNTPKLEPGSVSKLHLFALDKAEYVPDVVVVEDEAEKLMWIALAYLHATGGQRVMSATSVLQAACGDATVVPYIEKRLNFGLGCYGCRDATDIGPNETVLGFPADVLLPIVSHLEFLAGKAIPTSRSKRALKALRTGGGAGTEGSAGA